MKKVNTAAAKKIEKVEGQKPTIGLDRGDRSSWYCVLNAAGEMVLEQKLATTPSAETRILNLHRATIAHRRVRMEGWRQGQLSAGEKTSHKQNQEELT